MRLLITFIIFCANILSCTEEPKNLYNINEEPLSSEAEFKAKNWNGYNDFVFELKTLTDNFSKEYAIEKTKNLVSKSQAILYSMPSELRNEITNEKASELVQATKSFNDSIVSKSELEITESLNKIINAYTALNKEINYYSEN